jgi:hypothetical protein
VNKPDKVNLQSDQIVRILDGFMAAAIPHNFVESFKNADISLMLDDDRVLRVWRLLKRRTKMIIRMSISSRLAYSKDCAVKETRGAHKRDCFEESRTGVAHDAAHFGNNYFTALSRLGPTKSLLRSDTA